MPFAKVSVKYGKRSARSKAERLFAELPQSPIRKKPVASDDDLDSITEKLSMVQIGDEKPEHRKPTPDSPRKSPRKSVRTSRIIEETIPEDSALASSTTQKKQIETTTATKTTDEAPTKQIERLQIQEEAVQACPDDCAELRVLTWEEVCPPGDRIEKIAEASYAEVYRVINERGTSVIKVIRLPSPIKAQTKTQIKYKLVDEEPHSQDDINGELKISEWLADIPGFVVYKERYVVQGKATRGLLETHQAFQRRMKRKDPGRAQFYPSPSRYLEDTKFLVVELGDAGTALEDWPLTTESQLWDIFFLEAIALARAEELAMFEHRDLHEGNLCIRQVREPRERKPRSLAYFGYSGLDITILDYGLSRAEDLSIDFAKPIAYDLERDLGLFTSTHASQCKVYRQMRSFLLRADRKCLPPAQHKTPYALGVDGPLSWEAYAPYTNVLWLAYLYEYLVSHFQGDRADVARFEAVTADMWAYLNPEAHEAVPCFGSAGDIVCFAVEAGWLNEEQLTGGTSLLEREDSIILSRDDSDVHFSRRRSKRLSRSDWV